MGIIVGSETWMECDGKDCKKKSVPRYDQTEAVQSAYDAGWEKNGTNGKTYCPDCRWKNGV